MSRVSDFLSNQNIVSGDLPWRLLDTRPEGAFEKGHLLGAVSLAVLAGVRGDDFSGALPDGRPAAEIVARTFI